MIDNEQLVFEVTACEKGVSDNFRAPGLAKSGLSAVEEADSVVEQVEAELWWTKRGRSERLCSDPR